MFAERYFCDRGFAPRYFPKIGAAQPVDTRGRVTISDGRIHGLTASDRRIGSLTDADSGIGTLTISDE